MADTVNIGGPTTSGPNQLGTTWASVRAPAFKNGGVLGFQQFINANEDNENWGFAKPPDNPNPNFFYPRHPWYSNTPKYISSSGYPNGLDFLLRAKPFARPYEGGAISTCIGVNFLSKEYPDTTSDCYLTFGEHRAYDTGETGYYAYYDETDQEWKYYQFPLRSFAVYQSKLNYDYNNAKASLLGATVTVTINGDEFSVDITNDLFDDPKGVYITTVDYIPTSGGEWWYVVDVTR